MGANAEAKLRELKEQERRAKELAGKLRKARKSLESGVPFDDNPREKLSDEELYARKLGRQIEANRKSAIAFRDFGPIPAVVNRRRRNKAGKSLRYFCETYLSATFFLGWSEDHLRVIHKIERAVKEGGFFAMAMPRGSGKTALTEAAALWALLYGFRKYVILIGATEKLAKKLFRSIKTDLHKNNLLLEDFPEVCFPLRKMEGQSNRKIYCDGKPVEITVGSQEMRFPWIVEGKNGVSAGSILETCSITGAIRGGKEKLPDGRTIRPDLVIPDDPQTDESAKNEDSTKEREDTLMGAVGGLAGPGVKLSVIVPCTVICEGDLSSRILDRELHPDFNGEKIPFIKAFPDRMDLWDKYKELRSDSLREFGDIRIATKFYVENKPAMDAGASVMWESRFNEDEKSALQFGMNWKFKDEQSFWAELQQNPKREDDEELRLQTAVQIAKRINGLPSGRCLPGTQWITGFVDVQQKVLFYGLIAWRPDFTGVFVDYGTFPEQTGRRYYQLSDINNTLQKRYPSAAIDGSISAGIREFVPELLKRGFVREDDEVELFPNIVLVDANWKSPIVRDAIRSLRNSRVFPSHGRPIGASSNPITEYKRQRGDRVGLNWKTSTIEKQTHVLMDVNFWKSFIHDRLATEFGDAGSLTFPGSDPVRHRMIAEHLVSEYRVRVTASNGRTVDEWKEKASKPDNHLLDFAVGAAVGASMMGATVPGLETPVVRKKRRARVSYH